MLFVVIGYVSYAMCSTSYIGGLCTLYSVRYYRGEMYGVKGRGGEPRTYLLYGVSSVWGGGQKGVVRCEVESGDHLDSFAIWVIETNLLC